MIYLTSDTHFNHGNILVFEPWRLSWCANIKDMNEKLIDAWNKTVKAGDCVVHLGDFAFGNEQAVIDIVKQLNGKLILIAGNHDRSATSLKRCGIESYKRWEVIPDSRNLYSGFVCRHDPRHFKPEDLKGAIGLLHGHLHGHRHYDGIDHAITDRLLDVGVDAMQRIAPVSLEEIEEIFKNRTPWEPALS